MEHVTDIELVEKANDGDTDALEYLFEKHYMTVYRLAYRWCGIREDAEDIAQEVFIKLVRRLHTFSGNSSFTTWLYRITMNTAKDFGRRKDRKQHNEASFDAGQHQDRRDPNERDVLAATQLVTEINRLPIKQKESVLLVFAEGLSHKAAAKILGCREKTVSWRIFQARKRLRITLNHARV